MKKLLFLLIAASCAVSAIAQQKALLHEKFSDNKNGWTIKDNEKASASMDKKAYRMVHHRTSGSYLFLMDFAKLKQDGDFFISTEITQFQGEDSDGFGLVWGAADAGNFYGFNINSAGQFRIYQYKDFNYSEIKSFTQLSEIINSKGTSNHLSIRKTGGLMSFFANEHYLYSMPAKAFLGQQLGYVLYNQTEIHAHNLKIFQNKAMPIVFEDAFEDNRNNWISNARDSAYCIFSKERLVMRGEEDMGTTYKLAEGALYGDKDFEIEVNVRQAFGKKNKGYGLMWGAADKDNGYLFLINSFGSYAVYQRKDAQSVKLIDWTPSGQLLHLSIKPNKMVVRKVGKEYAFFLNDIWLKTIPYQKIMGDYLGFVLTADLRIEMESIAIREGEKSYTPNPPAITLLSPKSGGVTIDSKSLTFEVGINSSSKLNGVKLVLNGEQVSSAPKVDPSGEFNVRILKELELQEGANEIKLMAKNADGLVQQSIIQVTVNLPNQPIARNGNDYALFFATDDYGQWTDLVNPVNDVRTIARELEQNYGFNTELVIGATRKEVLTTLKQYARKKYGPNDQLMVFFAGHGKFDPFFGEGYVVTVDSEKEDEGNNSYVSHSSLRTIVNNIPCKHTFLVMDVCFGGTIDPFIAQAGHRGGNGSFQEMTQTEFIDRKLKFKTRKYLTSGGKEYVPDGNPGQHSPFARKFLEGLRNYGGHDRIITLGELTLYFERLMPEPRFGEFGLNEPGSDFLFIAR